MVAAIRQLVTVKRGGIVQVRSSRLKPGARAEVIVLLPTTPQRAAPKGKSNGPAARNSARKIPIARMTEQVRGDIAEAHRVRAAIRDGEEQLIPWKQVKRALDQR